MKAYVLKSGGQLLLLIAFLSQWVFLDLVRDEEDEAKVAISEVNDRPR